MLFVMTLSFKQVVGGIANAMLVVMVNATITESFIKFIFTPVFVN